MRVNPSILSDSSTSKVIEKLRELMHIRLELFSTEKVGRVPRGFDIDVDMTPKYLTRVNTRNRLNPIRINQPDDSAQESIQGRQREPK